MHVLRLVPLAWLLVALTGCGGGDDVQPTERGRLRYGVTDKDAWRFGGEGGVAVGEAQARPEEPAQPAAPTAAPTSTPRPAPAAPAAPARSGDYEVVQVTGGGRIVGTVKLDRAPNVPTIPVTKDQQKCGHDQHPSERIVFDEESLGLENCLVSIDVTKGKDWAGDMAKEERAAVLDQKGCVYVPHILVVRPGTQIVAVNSDTAEHNLHGYRGSELVTQFNFATAANTRLPEVAEAYLEEAAKYIVKCDIHPWMNAYIHAVPHPYHAVTDAKGRFELTDVPPGTYTIRCWHEGMTSTPVVQNGEIVAYTYGDDVVVTQQVTVAEGGETTADLVVPAP